jgi:hypothetical protein
MDAPLERRLDDRPRLCRLDATVVDAVGEHDEVAGEAVAADVRHLPDPFVLDLLAHRVVERTAELGATAVVLAVRADEEQRVLDRISGARELDAEKLVVPLEFEAPHGAARLRDENREAVGTPPVRAPDEEDAGVREAATLGDEVRLELRAQRRAVDGVVRPETAVLDQDPGVDAACRRVQRLAVVARRLRTERSTRLRLLSR